MRLATKDPGSRNFPTACQLNGTFAGFLPTVRYLTAVALVWYLIDRNHSGYSAFLKIFVLVQGTYIPQVIRHDWRTKGVHWSGGLRIS